MTMRTFQRRYLFTGSLTLKTGLHIGGGAAELSPSRNPIIRAPDGQPYIPGSSFKGAFRSAVEKLTPSIGLASCALAEQMGCPGAQGAEQRAFNEYRQRQRLADDELVRRLSAGVDLDVETPREAPGGGGKQRKRVQLCRTCMLFGSNYLAARIAFSDLYLEGESEAVVQVRDGVAIDRDSEKQVPGLLYDYEVVAPSLSFGLEVMLEDPDEIDLGLTCLGLQEFASGFVSLGGKRSRGLGRCTLANLQIYALDLTDERERAQRLRRYLLGATPQTRMTPIADPAGFLAGKIERLLA